MKIVFALAMIALLLVGCASLKETLKGIATDTASYTAESTQAADDVKKAVPELPYVFCIGIGYAAAFIRRWYKNLKIKENKKLV